MTENLEEKVRTINKKFKIGNDFLNTVAHNLVGNSYKIISEIISNSADEGAKNIYFTLKDGVITVTDDGKGMLENDIDGFLRAGDSNKIQRSIDEEKPFMGRFGVASILIPTLGGSYDINTISEEANYRFSEQFPDGFIGLERDIAVDEYKLQGNPTGTSLTINDVQLEEDFTLKSLRHVLQLEFSPFRDFNIYINGEELVPKRIDKAIKVNVDEVVPDVGHVNGIVYILKKNTKDWGMNLFVNQRNVVDPQKIVDASDIRYSIAKKSYGVLSVDGGELEQSILVNRQDFASTPAYKNIKAFLKKTLSGCATIYENSIEIDKADKIETAGKKHVRAAVKRLARKGIPDLNELARVDFAPLGEDEYPVTFDWDTQVFYVNTDHSRFQIKDKTQTDYYKNTLVDAVLFSLAEHRVTDIDDKNEAIDKIHEALSELYGIVNAGKEMTVKVAEKRVNPKVIYPVKDVRDLTGYGVGEMNYLISSRIFDLHMEDHILGSDVVKGQAKMEGKISLHEFAEKLYDKVTPVHIERLTGILDAAEEFALPFVERLEGPSRNGYFVHESTVEYLLELFESDELKPKKHEYNPKGVFEMQKHTFQSPIFIADKFGLAGANEVKDIVDYAQNDGIEVDKRLEQVSAASFVNALVHYEQNAIRN